MRRPRVGTFFFLLRPSVPRAGSATVPPPPVAARPPHITAHRRVHRRSTAAVRAAAAFRASRLVGRPPARRLASRGDGGARGANLGDPRDGRAAQLDVAPPAPAPGADDGVRRGEHRRVREKVEEDVVARPRGEDAPGRAAERLERGGSAHHLHVARRRERARGGLGRGGGGRAIARGNVGTPRGDGASEADARRGGRVRSQSASAVAQDVVRVTARPEEVRERARDRLVRVAVLREGGVGRERGRATRERHERAPEERVGVLGRVTRAAKIRRREVRRGAHLARGLLEGHGARVRASNHRGNLRPSRGGGAPRRLGRRHRGPIDPPRTRPLRPTSSSPSFAPTPRDDVDATRTPRGNRETRRSRGRRPRSVRRRARAPPVSVDRRRTFRSSRRAVRESAGAQPKVERAAR